MSCGSVAWDGRPALPSLECGPQRAHAQSSRATPQAAVTLFSTEDKSPRVIPTYRRRLLDREPRQVPRHPFRLALDRGSGWRRFESERRDGLAPRDGSGATRTTARVDGASRIRSGGRLSLQASHEKEQGGKGQHQYRGGRTDAPRLYIGLRRHAER
jgi:hypothetical protein